MKKISRTSKAVFFGSLILSLTISFATPFTFFMWQYWALLMGGFLWGAMWSTAALRDEEDRLGKVP